MLLTLTLTNRTAEAVLNFVKVFSNLMSNTSNLKSKLFNSLFVHKTNSVMRAIYPDFLWRKPNDEKKIYLTFDDGPITEITEFVLETLNKFNAKATFFCIGDNVVKHPKVFNKLIENQHTVGNHTFNHLKGWNTENNDYFENVQQCESVLFQDNQKKLFRPPYGRIKKSQAKILISDYEIVMWDVLTADYSKDISKENCLKNALKYTESGSIVVFHDSIKAFNNMSYTLPRLLNEFSEQGYSFESL